MKKIEKYKFIVQNNDPKINSFFLELQGKIKNKNLKKLKSDFVNVTKTDLETIKKLFAAQSTYKENQETITMRLIIEYKIVKEVVSVNVNKDFLEFLQTYSIKRCLETDFISSKKHTNTLYKIIDDMVKGNSTWHKFWSYDRAERVVRMELGITKSYKNYSALKNNILKPAQKEINKNSKYRIYFVYSVNYQRDNMIKIKIFKK
jgi:hypothetical protein